MQPAQQVLVASCARTFLRALEQLYFEAREQHFRATIALAHLQAEREYEREELLLDEFDLIDAYKQKVAEAARLRNILDEAESENFFQRMRPHNISIVPDNHEEFARTGRSRSI